VAEVTKPHTRFKTFYCHSQCKFTRTKQHNTGCRISHTAPN